MHYIDYNYYRIYNYHINYAAFLMLQDGYNQLDLRLYKRLTSKIPSRDMVLMGIGFRPVQDTNTTFR